MNDAHRRFPEWLASGAPGEPPRDAALHASVCPECLAKVAALDALTGVDPGRALLPASRAALHPTRGSDLARVARFAGVSVGVVLAAGLVGVGASQLLAGRVATGGPGPTPTPRLPAGEVLGATGTPAVTSSSAASPTPAGTPTEGPTQTTGASATRAPHTVVPTPPSATPRPRSPSPTRAPRPRR